MLSELNTESSQIASTIRILITKSWSLCYHGRCLSHETTPTLATLPEIIHTNADVKTLLSAIDDFRVCEGNPDENFLALSTPRKGRFLDSSGEKIIN